MSGLRGPDKGNIKGLTNLPVIEGGLLHAYSVGQKAKKKDKPPDEQLSNEETGDTAIPRRSPNHKLPGGEES